jgi:carboxyl-terminal processing protease
VGYVHIASFGGGGGADEIDEALASFGDATAVILDVRNNGGGSSNLAEAIAGRFVDGERVFAHVRWRNGPAHGDLTDYIALRVKPAARQFAGSVIVLTNRKAVSASEHFVLALRSQPSIVLVGDTTAGALGNPMIRELPNGWTYRLPQWIEYGPQREPYEGIGVAPAVVVRATAADSSAGRDVQLETALQLARTSD